VFRAIERESIFVLEFKPRTQYRRVGLLKPNRFVEYLFDNDKEKVLTKLKKQGEVYYENKAVTTGTSKMQLMREDRWLLAEPKVYDGRNDKNNRQQNNWGKPRFGKRWCAEPRIPRGRPLQLSQPRVQKRPWVQPSKVKQPARVRKRQRTVGPVRSVQPQPVRRQEVQLGRQGRQRRQSVDRASVRESPFHLIEDDGVPIGGRCRHFVQFWRQISYSKKVIQTILGVKMPFTSKPEQIPNIRTYELSVERKLVRDEMQWMVEQKIAT
jgi:hypothetical protein